MAAGDYDVVKCGLADDFAAAVFQYNFKQKWALDLVFAAQKFL